MKPENIFFLILMVIDIAAIVYFMYRNAVKSYEYLQIQSTRITPSKKAALLIEKQQEVRLYNIPLIAAIVYFLGLLFWFFQYSTLWPKLLQLF